MFPVWQTPQRKLGYFAGRYVGHVQMVGRYTQLGKYPTEQTGNFLRKGFGILVRQVYPRVRPGQTRDAYWRCCIRVCFGHSFVTLQVVHDAVSS